MCLFLGSWKIVNLELSGPIRLLGTWRFHRNHCCVLTVPQLFGGLTVSFEGAEVEQVRTNNFILDASERDCSLVKQNVLVHAFSEVVLNNSYLHSLDILHHFLSLPCVGPDKVDASEACDCETVGVSFTHTQQ